MKSAESTFNVKFAAPESLKIPEVLPQDVFTDALWEAEAKKKQERKETIIKNLSERGIKQVAESQLDTAFHGKTPVLFSGASKSSWPLISQQNQQAVVNSIQQSLDALDPAKAFIVTGGTEFGVEEIVHREARKRGFDIFGTFVTEAEVSSLSQELQKKAQQGSNWKSEFGQLTHFGFFGEQWYDRSAKVLELVKKQNGLVIFMGGVNILSDEIQAAENSKLKYLLMQGPEGAADRFSHIYTEHAFVGAIGLTERLRIEARDLISTNSGGVRMKQNAKSDKIQSSRNGGGAALKCHQLFGQ